MAQITLTRCDQCKREKKDKEQWLQLGLLGGPGKENLILLWPELPDSCDGVLVSKRDACSHACFHKMIDDLLGIKNIGRPRGSRNKKPKAQMEIGGAS